MSFFIITVIIILIITVHTLSESERERVYTVCVGTDLNKYETSVSLRRTSIEKTILNVPFARKNYT